MTQTIAVPASAGWYQRPGDPVDVTRHWDGTEWRCEVRGPIRDHFDYLRAMPAEARSPEDQELLRTLTRQVSDIEDLVLSDPRANPPLVQMAAPALFAPSGPYPPGQVPYRGVPTAYPGSTAYASPTASGYAPATGPYPPGPATPGPGAAYGSGPAGPYGPAAGAPYPPSPLAYAQSQPYASAQPYATAQPYASAQPYAPAHGMPGSTARGSSTPRFASAKPPRKRRTGRRVFGGLLSVVLVLVVRGIAYGVTRAGVQEALRPALSVGACVTLASASSSTNGNKVTWTTSDCVTSTNGAVSFVVVSKVDTAAQCDADSQYVQTLSGTTVTATYCLMENLAVGECVYEDDHSMLFDVPCTDQRALAKVTKRVEQGSGVACGTGEMAMQYPTGKRTYCLAKP